MPGARRGQVREGWCAPVRRRDRRHGSLPGLLNCCSPPRAAAHSCLAPVVGGEEGFCASRVVHNMDATASSASCNGGSGREKGPGLLAVLGKGTLGCEAVTWSGCTLLAGQMGYAV
ncbi:hypothetical protein HPB50_002444 [Hyalomma asiaticum]|uniref:Uncharacterized protein n=1 Tax=Hyalomma asiaticum TaxID=266040 RepID=A0ACB7RUV6_HYAAI|nr:hypothetical protein HPB50_002444 [Hyalomma asiaticum]